MIKLSEEKETRIDRYSFSRLNSFDPIENCLFCWYRTYIEGDRGATNGFADSGTYYHELIKQYFANELFLFEFKDKYTELFNNMKYKLPIFKRKNGETNLNIINYKKIINHIDGFDFFSDYEIVEFEQEYIFEIDGIPFIAIPDLVVTDKNNNFILFDHKVSNEWKPTEIKKKKRQMYLYALALENKYNKRIDKIKINFFKENKIIEYDFIEEEYKELKQWVYKKIREIEEAKSNITNENIIEIFKPRCQDKKNDFYAMYLCSHRYNCTYKK